MTSNPDIHKFALKWLDKFRSPQANSIDFLDHYMADDCKTLGFEMDCGQAFEEKYGKAVSNSEALKNIIDEVDDVMLLGSAIFSRWRYFNHWAWSGDEIMESENREWFITALYRMAALTNEWEKWPRLLTGKIHRIKICSNSICFGPTPMPEDEVEQHLTIIRDGRVFFSSYLYGDGNGRYKKNITKNFKVDPKKAEHILNLFEQYFSKDYRFAFATDVGDWKMEITNDTGEVFKFHGPLCGAMAGETELSDLVRDELQIKNLYVFDGNVNEWPITSKL